MNKKNTELPKVQEPAQVVEVAKNANVANVAKDMQTLKERFDRLSAMFYKKEKFENALKKLVQFKSMIDDEKKDETEWQSSYFAIQLVNNNSSRDAISISNIVIVDALIAELVKLIEAQTSKIDEEIMKF